MFSNFIILICLISSLLSSIFFFRIFILFTFSKLPSMWFYYNFAKWAVPLKLFIDRQNIIWQHYMLDVYGKLEHFLFTPKQNWNVCLPNFNFLFLLKKVNLLFFLSLVPTNWRSQPLRLFVESFSPTCRRKQLQWIVWVADCANRWELMKENIYITKIWSLAGPKPSTQGWCAMGSTTLFPLLLTNIWT